MNQLRPMHDPKHRQAVDAFARALDQDDFQAARYLLAHACVYDTGNAGLLTNPEAIIDSYRTNSLKARRAFDNVQYTSQVRDADQPGTFVVEFIDTIRKGHLEHVFRSYQRIEVAGTQIQRICHIELTGERDKLQEFMKTVGVT